ncbi:hypothetical protein NC652_005789 [Populus alba x Populus x berolinensis]|nr:hypothetical protein NC652_005789 [Populus alba x Populus x berolinensis]
MIVVKPSSLIDDLSHSKSVCFLVIPYSFPVSSGEEALLKARNEVMHDRVHFVWTQVFRIEFLIQETSRWMHVDAYTPRYQQIPCP